MWLESEGLGKGTTCKMYISLGITECEKGPRNSPRLDSRALPELKNFKVYSQSLTSKIYNSLSPVLLPNIFSCYMIERPSDLFSLSVPLIKAILYPKIYAH